MRTASDPEQFAEVFLPELPSVPYPGLRPFEKPEWPIFFGRERMTESVIDQLLRRHIVVVHGVSGCGKSSLIRAGVQPQLEQRHARSGLKWRTCATRPGNRPLANLADTLAGVAADKTEPLRIELRRALNQGGRAPEAVSRLTGANGSDRVCILLDQFEELFRFSGEFARDESSLLTDFLNGFQEKPPAGLYIIVTMRSEFLGECARFPGLAETINHTQFLLPRMTVGDLLHAVREPAALYGGRVTDRLTERLIADARGGQDELPLIQHGLSRLWQFASPNSVGGIVLDGGVYEARGPLGRLLSEHADSVADAAAKDAEGERIIQEAFRALADIDAEGRAVRRPQTLAELVAVAGTTVERMSAILDVFRQPGISFITPYPPEELRADTTIDISHEALIRRWGRIADKKEGWLQREFRDGLVWRALVVQAESFAANPMSLLSEATTEARGEWLTTRNKAWSARYGGRWSAVQELMTASRVEVEKRRREAEAERQREEALRREQEGRAATEKLLEEQRRRAEAEEAKRTAVQELATRQRRFTWAAAAVAALTVVLAVLAGWQWWQAETAEKLALIQKSEAEQAKVAAEQQTQVAIEQRAKAEQARTEADKARAEAESQERLAAANLAEAQQALKALRLADLTQQQATAAVAQPLDSLRKAKSPADIVPLIGVFKALVPSLSPAQVRDVFTPIIAAIQRTDSCEIRAKLAAGADGLVDSLSQAQAEVAFGATLDAILDPNSFGSVFPCFPSLDEQQTAKEVITKNWDSVVGANVK